MHAEVAEKFVSNNNRVILAGDAAHRFPPAGGFGELSMLFLLNYWYLIASQVLAS